MFQYYKWEELNINWEAVNMTWEEVGFVINELIPLSAPITGKPHDLEKINKLSKNKKKKIIKLVCKITGEDDEYISYKYKNEDIQITARDVDIILNEILKNKVEVHVQDIS
jgi:hypothetical protein